MYCKCGQKAVNNEDLCKECLKFLNEERLRWELESGIKSPEGDKE